MSDVWASVAALDAATQDRLAEVLEARGADAQQQAMRHAFFELIEFPAEAQVLDVGCGTGVLTRRLAEWPGVGSVAGVVPRHRCTTRRELAVGLGNVTFREDLLCARADRRRHRNRAQA